jgi:hypothetical protein
MFPVFTATFIVQKTEFFSDAMDAKSPAKLSKLKRQQMVGGLGLIPKS